MRAPPITVLFLVLGLAACGKGTSTTTASDNAPPPPPPAAAEDASPTGSLAARTADAEPSNTREYDCEDLRITVAQDGAGADERARFVVDGVTLDLQTVQSPQGERFADTDGNGFWRHGTDEARLSLQGQSERNCTRVY